MSSDQNYLEMRVLIQKHKDNERIYKEKISEVNLTRARIHDQLEILKQTYDKKVKSLEQKLQNMKLQNQTLLRQNLLFKTQIDTYQNRLLEKQKIIAVLLNQKRETLINGNSQKSKSDKTQSNQAIQQEGKHFKKQIPSFRDSPQEAEVGLNRYKEQTMMANKINTEFKSQASKIKNAKQKDRQEIVSKSKKQIGFQQHQIQVQSIERSHLKQSKDQVQQNQLAEDNLQNSAANYFESLAKNKQEQQFEVKQEIQTQVRKKPPPPKKKTGKVVPQPPANKPLPKRSKNTQVQIQEEQKHTIQSNRPNEKYQYTENSSLKQNEIHIDSHFVEQKQKQEVRQQQVQNTYQQQNQEQAKQFNYPQNYANVDAIQESQPQIQTKSFQHRDQISYVSEQRQFQQEEESATYNNFLSHFSSQPQNQQEMVGASMSPKPLARKKKATKKVIGYIQEQNVQQDHSINSTDFFNQLNKHDHEVLHQFEIQQSSIDQNDRDSSLISNQQHYFVQQQTVQKAKPVKMTKKKGKRDQIKVADPSLFE